MKDLTKFKIHSEDLYSFSRLKELGYDFFLDSAGKSVMVDNAETKSRFALRLDDEPVRNISNTHVYLDGPWSASTVEIDAVYFTAHVVKVRRDVAARQLAKGHTIFMTGKNGYGLFLDEVTDGFRGASFYIITPPFKYK